MFHLDGKGRLADVKLPTVATLHQKKRGKQPLRVLVVQAEVGQDGKTTYGIIGGGDIRAAAAEELVALDAKDRRPYGTGVCLPAPSIKIQVAAHNPASEFPDVPGAEAELRRLQLLDGRTRESIWAWERECLAVSGARFPEHLAKIIDHSLRIAPVETDFSASSFSHKPISPKERVRNT